VKDHLDEHGRMEIYFGDGDMQVVIQIVVFLIGRVYRG